MVCTDPCGQVLRGVLMQDNDVICYESRKLKEHEKNYATHDIELASIVHALKMWRHYLMGRRFELRINHCVVVIVTSECIHLYFLSIVT